MWRDRHKTWFTDEERARLEALGDEMAAAMETDTTPKVKIKGSDRQTGTVKWYNSAKGFGFITSQSGPDVFVHRRAIVGGIILQEGQIVDYVEVAGQKGPQAEGVELRTP
jgi:cold shock protein